MSRAEELAKAFCDENDYRVNERIRIQSSFQDRLADFIAEAIDAEREAIHKDVIAECLKLVNSRLMTVAASEVILSAICKKVRTIKNHPVEGAISREAAAAAVDAALADQAQKTLKSIAEYVAAEKALSDHKKKK
jgi:hypothetical protein